MVTVPDEDLYEQGVFPSTFNLDHKWTLTIFKRSSWSHRSVNVLDLLKSLPDGARIEKIELLNATYRNGLPRFDQTATPVGECGIEFVLRKAPAEEMATLGRRPGNQQPDANLRIHFNQYVDDIKNMKRLNNDRPPFRNTSEL